VDTCSLGHREKRKCHEPSGACKRCEKEKKEQAKRLQKEYEEQQRRAAQQVAHDKRMKELEERIVEQRQKIKDEELRLQQDQILAQKRQDLVDVTKEAAEARANPTSYFKQLFSPVSSSSTSSAPSSNTAQPTSVTDNATSSVQGSTPTPGHMRQHSPPRPSTPPGNAATMNRSSPEAEWKRQKLVEGASNPHMDAVMDMIGLEEVKRQMLGIKDKIDVVQRQGTSLKGERFNVTFLGNPGTGMWMHLRLQAESSS
jgi:hypothetical protein